MRPAFLWEQSEEIEESLFLFAFLDLVYMYYYYKLLAKHIRKYVKQ